MKRFALVIIAVFALTAVACDTTEDANDKINDCLADNYEGEVTDEVTAEWEIDCDDSEDTCDDCIECIMDTGCTEILEGDCLDVCTFESEEA